LFWLHAFCWEYGQPPPLGFAVSKVRLAESQLYLMQWVVHDEKPPDSG
jgi:hypothetical protein